MPEHRCQALKRDGSRCPFSGRAVIESRNHRAWFCRVHVPIARRAVGECLYIEGAAPEDELFDIYESRSAEHERRNAVQCEALTAWISRSTGEPVRCTKMSPTGDHVLHGRRVCPTHYDELGQPPRFGFVKR